MVRGEALYPKVAVKWADDLGFHGRTKQNYLNVLRRFQTRVNTSRDPKRFAEITADDVANFVNFGHNGAPRADRTRAHYLGIIYQVYDWAMDTEVELVTRPAGNPAARLRSQARQRRVAPRDVAVRTWLSADRARILIATTRGDGVSPIDIRDAVVLSLYLYTGLRCSELLRIRWRDVDFGTGTIRVVRKGGSLCEVNLGDAAHRLTFEWRSRFIEAVGPDIADLHIIPQVLSIPAGPPSADLTPCINGFRTDPGKRHPKDRHAPCPTCGKEVRILLDGTLWAHGTRGPRTRDHTMLWTRGLTSTARVREIVGSRARAAGITHLRPHDLRRSFAGMLEDQGDTLRDIQAQLGHKHMSTTERYLEQRPKLSRGAASLDFG